MKPFFRLLALVIIATSVWAQEQGHGRVEAAGGVTAPVSTYSALPGTCTPWQMVMVTTAAAGANLSICTATNTFVGVVPATGATGALDCVTTAGVCDIVTTVVPRLSAANTFTGNMTLTGTQFSAIGATHTAPVTTNIFASIPATCTVGDEFFATDKTPPNYNCTATNTWTQIPTGGGGSAPNWTVANTHTWTLMDAGLTTFNSLSNIGTLTSKKVYGFEVPVITGGTVNTLETYIRVNPAGGTGVALGIFQCASGDCTNASLLKGTAILNASGQPADFTVSGGQALVAGTVYAFTLCTDDNTTVNFVSATDGGTITANYLNAGVTRLFSAANPCTGSGGSLTFPASLGALTPVSNLPIVTAKP